MRAAGSRTMKPDFTIPSTLPSGRSRLVHNSSITFKTLLIPPKDSWDSHMHLIEPIKYPYPAPLKIPAEATMSQAKINAQRLNLPNMVFVQLSGYRDDNTWILDALREVGLSHGRGVVAFDPETIDLNTLRKWHDLGVRGVRLNLRSSKSTMSRSEIQRVLRKYAEKLGPLKTWSVGVYADMEVLEHIQPLLGELEDVKIVLEHFGSPAVLPLDPTKPPKGWDALNRMMEDPSVFVKISAPYLFSTDPEFKDLESLTKALYGMRDGEGVVFASDWPHTQKRGFDPEPFMERCIEWCEGNEDLLRKLFRDNAKVLWDV